MSIVHRACSWCERESYCAYHIELDGHFCSQTCVGASTRWYERLQVRLAEERQTQPNDIKPPASNRVADMEDEA